MKDIKLYPEMNEEIKKILRFNDDPLYQYILARIEQLEEELNDLREIWDMYGGEDGIVSAFKKDECVVFPCKVGDTVFDIYNGSIHETKVIKFSYLKDHWACLTESSYPNVEDFGRRIFLTREEAAVALERMLKDVNSEGH